MTGVQTCALPISWLAGTLALTSLLVLATLEGGFELLAANGVGGEAVWGWLDIDGLPPPGQIVRTDAVDFLRREGWRALRVGPDEAGCRVCDRLGRRVQAANSRGRGVGERCVGPPDHRTGDVVGVGNQPQPDHRVILFRGAGPQRGESGGPTDAESRHA